MSQGYEVMVRDAVEEDVKAIQAIYAFHVRNGLASFEEEAPTVEEMSWRWLGVRKLQLPYLVAIRAGEVCGYSYATSYRARPAYRFTVENSVYVRNGLAGGGIGKMLLRTLIERCEQGPWRQMLAVIGNSANLGSIALHRKAGFETVGTLKSVGFKHGQWVDTVLMQRGLGLSANAVPKLAARE